MWLCCCGYILPHSRYGENRPSTGMIHPFSLFFAIFVFGFVYLQFDPKSSWPWWIGDHWSTQFAHMGPQVNVVHSIGVKVWLTYQMLRGCLIEYAILIAAWLEWQLPYQMLCGYLIECAILVAAWLVGLLSFVCNQIFWGPRITSIRSWRDPSSQALMSIL